MTTPIMVTIGMVISWCTVSETWELSVTNLWMYWLETITELSLHVQSYLMDILTVQDFYSTIDSRYMLLCMVDSQKCWAKLTLSYTVYFQIHNQNIILQYFSRIWKYESVCDHMCWPDLHWLRTQWQQWTQWWRMLIWISHNLTFT